MDPENFLQCHPDPIYVNPIKLPYISGHQPLLYDHVTQVDYIVKPATPVPVPPAIMPYSALPSTLPTSNK